MEVKEGYYNSELGIIPSDWQTKPIREITSLMTNGFVGTVKSHYANYEEGILYIQGYNVEENSFNFSGIKRVTKEFHQQHTKSVLQEGDLLTIQTGDIGVTTIVPKELAGSNCHALIISRFKKAIVEPKFYSYYFNSSKGRSRLKEIETGSTMKHINVGDMIRLLLPFPPKSEQIAIATALSDTDALISSLEKLIAKKHNIKQGVMQELFKPKKGWRVKRLGEIGKVYGGLSGKSKNDFDNGIFPYIPFMNIMNNSIIDLSHLGFVKIKNGESQNIALKGDLFFNGSSETPEEVGMCSVLMQDRPNLYLNSFCFGYRLYKDSNADGLFLSYFFRSSFGRNLFFSMAQGATRYNLSKANFNKLEIHLPSMLEQRNISEVIFDIDSEINALDRKLSKYHQIKTGMMQNLLTGKIRLV
jgi:type I restriction enzyme S subunit